MFNKKENDRKSHKMKEFFTEKPVLKKIFQKMANFEKRSPESSPKLIRLKRNYFSKTYLKNSNFYTIL